ncbi:unnamed protein product [Heligmosomoides polygyrus]|uniref:Uncharacterized protein n=1 Tax=Heligmosomoides polygyrus TaxID=6339 RepID=A0A183FWP5_HELPZ|nr:unnamed protein product [Heligmosomoides polygyrus]
MGWGDTGIIVSTNATHTGQSGRGDSAASAAARLCESVDGGGVTCVKKTWSTSSTVPPGRLGGSRLSAQSIPVTRLAVEM